MTIAVSALIRPSRLLIVLVTGMSVGLTVCGVLLFVGFTDVLRYHARASIAAVCIIAGLAGFFLTCVRKKAFRIDISGTGQIRLNDTSRGVLTAEGGQTSGERVQLLSDSTLWPTLLILRLQSESGRVMVVPVLPDSLTRHDFRAVCVACRWIAAQNTRPAAEVARKNLLSD